MGRHRHHHRKHNRFGERYQKEILISLMLFLALGVTALVLWFLAENSYRW
jgi:hypothetical protein